MRAPAIFIASAGRVAENVREFVAIGDLCSVSSGRGFSFAKTRALARDDSGEPGDCKIADEMSFCDR